MFYTPRPKDSTLLYTGQPLNSCFFALLGVFLHLRCNHSTHTRKTHERGQGKG